MKNLILTLIMLFTVATYTSAQGKKPVSIEGKPSYTETTDFIKTHFAEDFFTSGKRFNADWLRGEIVHERKYSIVDVAFTDNCVLNIEYEVESTRDFDSTGTKTIKRSIDLSQTESFSLLRVGEEEYRVYGLIFNVKNSPKKDEIDLPFTRLEVKNADSDENFKSLKEDKIYKAFNHLRKLCGAPEPIEF